MKICIRNYLPVKVYVVIITDYVSMVATISRLDFVEPNGKIGHSLKWLKMHARWRPYK